MNIVWCSNFSSQSAYSIQGRLWVNELRRAGHHVDVFELSNGGGLPKRTTDGVTVYPVALDPLGSDMIEGYTRQLKADCIITLVDVWGLAAWPIERLGNLFPLTPIDHQPCPPDVTGTAKRCTAPIAISRFGFGELQRAGLSPLYWPHAIDPNIWQPGDKQAARARQNIDPDVFWVSFVGVNDSNPSRKGLPELLIAWQMFVTKHPHAQLYLHTSRHGNLPVSPATGGVRIDDICKTIGLDPRTIVLVDQHRYRSGLPAHELVEIARASDVLILPSRGEGFGMPLLEFQRVGCPVITSNYAAGAELCFSGWKTEGEVEWTWQNAFWMKPGIASLYEALEAAYEERDNPLRRQRAIEGAREYDVQNVAALYMRPVLQHIGEMALENYGKAAA